MAENDGKIMLGQQYDRQDNFIIGFTQTMMDSRNADALVGQALTEISPVDLKNSQVRVYSVPSSSLDTFLLSFDTTTSFDLPAFLSDITVTFNKSSQNGESIHDLGIAFWQGTSGGMNLDPVSSAQGSASILPDVTFSITQTWAQNVPIRNYLFYINGNVTNTVTSAQVITKLQTALTVAATSVLSGVTTSAAHGLTNGQPFQFATVSGGAGGIAALTTYYVITPITTNTFTYSTTSGGSAAVGHSAASATLYPVISTWPVFRPASHTLTLKGGQLSLSQSADSHLQYGWNTNGNISYAWTPFGASRSDSKSREGGVTIRTIRTPPTIHGLISLGLPTDEATSSITVKANVFGITGFGGAPSFPPIFNEPAPLTGSVVASVSPTLIAATSGQTSIPTAGLYILDTVAEPFQYGYNRVRVQVVNFSYFA